MAEGRESPTQEELREYLRCWQLPGATLAPDQARALLAWSGTPDDERRALKASIAASEQQVEAKPLESNRGRGHDSWLNRRVEYTLNDDTGNQPVVATFTPE